MKNLKKSYWTERGNCSYKYKNEEFYTITPIPYYYERRKRVIEELDKIIKLDTVNAVCDFGCGDGYYINKLYNKNKNLNIKWFGVDVSETMLKRAKENFPSAAYSNDLDDHKTQFDIIYSISVLAHITEESVLLKILNQISKSLKVNGYFIMFELTAPVYYGDDVYRRRPYYYYQEKIESLGLSLIKNILFFYNSHVFFERYIAKIWYNKFSYGADETERKLNANRHFLFRLMSNFFTKTSFKKIRRPDKTKWGYNFMVFKKNKLKFAVEKVCNYHR